MCISHKSIWWNSYTFFFSNRNPNTNPNPEPSPNPNPKPNPNPYPKTNPYPKPKPNTNPNTRNLYTFKTRWLSFKVKHLQRKGTQFSF